MSYELFKSMTYKNNKVYTGQCSNNVSPKDYSVAEHRRFSEKYQELGKDKFEKWFISNCIIEGNVVILINSNKILQVINQFTNNLYKNPKFRNLQDEKDVAWDRLMEIKYDKNCTEEMKESATNKLDQATKKLCEYISKEYDIFKKSLVVNNDKNKNREER